LTVPRLDREIGIEVYATKSKGVSGRIRQFPEDFKVEEILTDGSKAHTEPAAYAPINTRGRYLVCVLVKRNCDTILAVQKVSQTLGISPERINIGGIKDARALTAQHVSIGRMLPEQVVRFKLKDIWLYPLRFSSEKINSEMLFGNEFHITLRAVNLVAPEIMKRTRRINEELAQLGGCPNFFGHQRFGTARPITHLVGKHMLQGEWEKAALMFLAKPSLHEHPESRGAREQLWKTLDFRKGLGYFPRRLVYELQMLEHLAERPRDFLGAFHRLPKKLCQLFIQAYQSYLFNRFLSQRIKRGLPLKKPQRGEHVLKIDGGEYLALPLVGYKQWVSSGEQGEIERRILEEEEEDVAPENFKFSVMPKISSSGGLRTAITPIIEFKPEKPLQDDANPNKRFMSLSFTLRKGSYATVVLREFMKPRNPLKAGF